MFTLAAPGFSLAHTLASGQLFRYERVPEGYLVAHGNKAFVVSHNEATSALVIHFATPNVTEAWVRHFFALDEAPPEPLASDTYAQQALAYCSGLRICNQEPWECTIGFLCSQNNNVARIRELMTGLATTFGTHVPVGPYTAHTFPEPGTITPGLKLDAIRAGYRAHYLVAASELLSHELLESMYGLDYADAKEALQLIHGVGPKVADCILLFAYGHTDAFPIDTWVAHIMRMEYRCRTLESMRRKAQKQWGAHAGVMQQYLFHYARTGART